MDGLKGGGLMRKAEIQRKTNETDIRLELSLDGEGALNGLTHIGFFDHMLHSFVRIGLFDLKLEVTGDTHIDDHHTVEDVGIVLGQGIRKAIGDKKGIQRYGSTILPMDEVLVLVAVDLGGRPYFSFDVDLPFGKVGSFDTELVEEFFKSVAFNAQMNLHMKVLSGSNVHHIIEALFKAFGKALDQATQKDERIKHVMSTKGVI